MNNKIILLSVLILLSALSPFLFSNTLANVSIVQSFFFNSLFYFIIAMVICAFYCTKGELSTNIFKELTNEQIMGYSFLAIVYISTTFLSAKLYKSFPVSEITPYKNTLTLLLQFIIGYLILKNKPTSYKILGGLLMILGVYVFSL
jgi:drug/metabolite transporter (DMT)-like permease